MNELALSFPAQDLKLEHQGHMRQTPEMPNLTNTTLAIQLVVHFTMKSLQDMNHSTSKPSLRIKSRVSYLNYLLMRKVTRLISLLIDCLPSHYLKTTANLLPSF